MIIEPDFLRHYKCKKLIAMVDGDRSVLLSLIALWAHCQVSRKWEFPELDKYDLASICEWTFKLPCERSLIASRFIEKINGGGYRVLNWNEHNAQLIQKWRAGEKGGRPPFNENPSKTGESEKPTDNRPITDRSTDQIDPNDPTRSEMNEKKDPNQSDTTKGRAVWEGLRSSFGIGGSGPDVSGGLKIIGDGPTLDAAFEFGRERYSPVWEHAEDWIRSWFKTMTEAHWQDRKRKPIADWRKNMVAYCDVCWRKIKGIGAPENKEEREKRLVRESIS